MLCSYEAENNETNYQVVIGEDNFRLMLIIGIFFCKTKLSPRHLVLVDTISMTKNKHFLTLPKSKRVRKKINK